MWFLLNKINDGTVIKLSILFSLKKLIGLILSANEIKGAIESFNTGLGTNVSQVASSLLSSQFSGIDTGFQGILSSAPTSEPILKPNPVLLLYVSIG